VRECEARRRVDKTIWSEKREPRNQITVRPGAAGINTERKKGDIVMRTKEEEAWNYCHAIEATFGRVLKFQYAKSIMGRSKLQIKRGG